MCLCEALVSLRHTYLVSFLLYPEDIKKLGVRPIWSLGKVTGLLEFSIGFGAQRPVLRPRCIGPGRARTHIFYYILH